MINLTKRANLKNKSCFIESIKKRKMYSPYNITFGELNNQKLLYLQEKCIQDLLVIEL